MKLNKVLAFLGAATMLVGSAFAVSACAPTEEDNKGGKTTYVLEAEYIDLSNVSGSGMSDSKSGVGVIFGDGTQAEKDKGWSEGYYVMGSYSTDFQLDFKFTADKAGTASIMLRLGSELGDLTMSSAGFSVQINGTEINYSNMYIAGTSTVGALTEVEFQDKLLSASVALKAGENTLTLKTLANDYRGAGSTGGPMIDCVKITTACKLTYTEHKDNPSLRGGL